MEVFGGAGGERDLVYVRLPNNTTRGVPAWMFDESICAGIRSAERPTIDCQALLGLAQLLDSWKPDAHSAGHEPSIMSSQNTSPSPPGAKSTPSGFGTDAVKRMASKHDPHKVPAPLARVTADSRSERKDSKRRGK